jgi:hypothetical protein
VIVDPFAPSVDSMRGASRPYAWLVGLQQSRVAVRARWHHLRAPWVQTVKHWSGVESTAHRTAEAAFTRSTPVRCTVTTGLASTLAVVVIAAAGWLHPHFSFASAGLSLSGVHDEGVGFRYFYTLRRLYGDDEHPWVPHGQVPGLMQTSLQLALTAAGYPPTRLHPRIDVWTYLASGIPLALAALLLGWAVQPIRSALGRVLIGLTFVAITYETAIFAEYQLTTPEYHPWVHLYAVVALGWLLRLAGGNLPSLPRQAVLLGLYTTACLATKPSYLPFPATIGLLLLLLQTNLRRAVLLIVGSAIVTGAGLLATTWVFYLGDVGATINHFRMIPPYVRGEMVDAPIGVWIGRTSLEGVWALPASLTNPRIWLILLPILLVMSMWYRARWRLTLALLVGSALYLYALDRRPTPATHVETYDFLVVAATTWLWGVALPWASTWTDRHVGSTETRRRVSFAAGQAVLAGAVLLAGWWASFEIARFDAKIRPLFEVATEGERQLARFIADTPGRTLFAFADYPHRPITIDAAIHRGGITQGTTWAWTSPLIREMFPDRGYLLGGTGDSARPDPQLGRYRKVVYTYHPAVESEAAALARLEERLRVHLDGFECPFEYRFWDTTQPTPVLTDVIIVKGCRRSRQV